MAEKYDPIEESILTTSKEKGDDGDGDTVALVTFAYTFTSYIYAMVQNVRSTECGFHINNTTLVFSCWLHGLATAA